MPIEIIVPRLGWSMEEGAFVAWLKKDGEFVRPGDALFSIEGDKAVQEIESIDSGILRIAAHGPKPGDSIRVGDLLGHLVSSDDPSPELAPATEQTEILPPSDASTRPAPTSGLSAQVPTETPVRRRSVDTISPRALRIAGELGVDWTTVKGTGRTGRIRERDIRAVVSPTSVVAGNKPTVLVTGGCGFIGTWVIRELLARGLGVVVLDGVGPPTRWQRVIGTGGERIPLVQGSVLDRELLARIFAEHGISHIIHLAALLTPACQADPWEGCRVNVLGGVALFEQVRNSPHRIEGISYTSSVAVFGDEPGDTSQATDSETPPPTFYGAFKKSIELIAAQYWCHFQIASVGVRPQVAYGPERDGDLTAGPSLAARAAARGEPFCISYTGRVGYDYVEDVARAFVRGALETPRGAPVVDLPGELADVYRVIGAIAAATPEAAPKLSAEGPPIPAHAPPNPCYISQLYPDWNTTSLDEGMRRTVQFYL